MKTIEDLIPKLLATTNAGRLRWKQTHTSGTYAADLKSTEVRVWEWEDPEDGSEGITLAVLKGPEIIDSIYYDKYASQYDKFRILFAAARRSALNLDKIVEALDDELDNL